MTITINGSTGINTPGVVNTAAETIATTLGVTGVTTIAAGSAAAPSLVGTTGGATTGVWFPAGNTIAFANGGVESARINSSGSLLVGTTTNLGNSSVLNIKQSIGGNTASFQNGSDAGWGIAFLHVAGSAAGSISWTATTTTFSTSSDYRLKEAISPMTGALARVNALKPCTYKWKLDGSDGQGFIAHELQAVVPECVIGEKDGVDADGNPKYQGIDTSFLVATLTAAIQEQQALITSLTTRLTALENK